jgi:hypothetical protein
LKAGFRERFAADFQTKYVTYTKKEKDPLARMTVQDTVGGECPGRPIGQVVIRIHIFAEPIDASILGAGRWQYEWNNLYEPAAEFACFP